MKHGVGSREKKTRNKNCCQNFKNEGFLLN
jgi:hypothetical protein